LINRSNPGEGRGVPEAHIDAEKTGIFSKKELPQLCAPEHSQILDDYYIGITIDD